MNVEELKADFNSAVERAEALAAEVDAADKDTVDEVIERFEAANAEVRTLGDRIENVEKVATARAANKPLALAATPARSLQVNEEPVYRENGDTSFFKDLMLVRGGDSQARERLDKNNLQVAEERSISTSATAGGEFVVPVYLNNLWAQKARAGRAFADQCNNLGDPQSMTVNVPAVTTGATTAVQTDNGNVSNTDQVTAQLIAATQTIAGMSKGSYQLQDFSTPGIDAIIYQDLLADYNKQLDDKLLNSTTTNAKGVFKVSSINSVTYTQTTPAPKEFTQAVFQGVSQVASNGFGEADLIVMNPKTWFWYLSQADSNNRPLAQALPATAQNVNALFNGGQPQGIVGTIGGIPVCVDGNVITTDGTGTNQGQIAVVDRSNLLLWEGAPRFKVADQTGIGTLTNYYVLYNYAAWMFGRYPTRISAVTGTGLVVQSNF